MELKDFVAQTLTSIAEGIKEAQETAGSDYRIAPPIQNNSDKKVESLLDMETRRIVQGVDFDVAVTTTQGIEGEANAKIFGAQGALNAQYTEENLSRVKFKVYVTWPYPKKMA